MAIQEGDTIQRSVFNSINFDNFDLKPRPEMPYIYPSLLNPIKLIIPFSYLYAKELPDGNFLVKRNFRDYGITIFGFNDEDESEPTLQQCVFASFGSWSKQNVVDCFITEFKQPAIQRAKSVLRTTRKNLAKMQDSLLPFEFDPNDFALTSEELND